MLPLQHADLLSAGLNCGTGPEFMTDHLRTLSEMAATRVSCYPNAGLPERGRRVQRDARNRSPSRWSASWSTAG